VHVRTPWRGLQCLHFSLHHCLCINFQLHFTDLMSVSPHLSVMSFSLKVQSLSLALRIESLSLSLNIKFLTTLSTLTAHAALFILSHPCQSQPITALLFHTQHKTLPTIPFHIRFLHGMHLITFNDWTFSVFAARLQHSEAA